MKKSQESPIVFALQGQYGEKITIQTDDDATMKANTGYYFKNNGCVKQKIVKVIIQLMYLTL